MEKEEILEIFRETGAFLEGHFLLTSGLHSPVYIEKFKVLQFPRYVEILAGEIAHHFSGEKNRRGSRTSGRGDNFSL